MNARYMKAPQFNQLVENLRADGVLTSTPLIHNDVILSGNHRVEAARKAGIEEADVVEIVTDLSPQRQVAIQLSHNALVGQDDPSLLASLYDGLDFDTKLYSGITDDMLNVGELDLGSLSSGSTAYTDILLTFLPEQADAFLKCVERLEKGAAKHPIFLARGADFEQFFDAIVAVRAGCNVLNMAMVVATMAELALERLAEREREAEARSEAMAEVEAMDDAGASVDDRRDRKALP